MFSVYDVVKQGSSPFKNEEVLEWTIRFFLNKCVQL